MTSQEIRLAAQKVFTDKGYDKAGLREIAALAGVNVALISRYFGSKEDLFASAVFSCIELDALLQGPRNEFGARAVVAITTKEKEDDFDPGLALFRSATSPIACPIVKRALQKNVVDPIASWLGGRDAQLRASLIAAHMAGFDICAHIMKLDALSQEQDEAKLRMFAQALQSYVDIEE
ncbi:TetR/AcrR family transcriptional regulator [Cochlodiniinecator piscidefendens]|uniref:TetR/AcrR family transcriptional regulator n=1 Tax=Cochlodiniinecator piscidefendens TaxID=2715756 RepID=UPI00140A4ECC|nr:TetR family transcriptional regulator [Cochlodiniinecator piscidefendens]